ncbi:sigma-54-dependent Fis family transcriptional regulator [Nannocystaceae bacterium ST9]
MGPLILADVDEAAWQAFEAGRHGDPRHVDHRRSWQRSRVFGARSDDPRLDEHVLVGAGLREHVERLEPVAVLGEAILDRATQALAAHDFTLLVADTEGVIVAAAGGGSFADEARRARLIAGACWSEAIRGTNAIGTALAERRAVVVAGRAHYARTYRDLVCHAAPILDTEGEVVGVLDATSLAREVDPAITAIVGSAAAALSDLLRLRAWGLAGAGVIRTLTRTLDRMIVPALVIEPPGRIARCNAPARELLARGELELDYDQLRREALAPTPGGLVLHAERRTSLRVQVEPVAGHDDPLIGLLVILEPIRCELPAKRSRPRSEPAPASSPASAPAPASSRRRELEHDPFAAIFGEDPELRAALGRARSVARSRIPVVLLAETGSGKELVAQAIHRASSRAAGPFLAINCGSLAPSLLETELFGHAPGAFTGAGAKGRHGLLHAASGGTLFLDEVAEMSTHMQTALLRVLETGEYTRVGSSVGEQVDVRVICATCKDLPSLVASGQFRSDLYYRLKGMIVRLPPLRERSDVVALARHLLATIAAHEGVPVPELAPEVEARLAGYAWPGNVRELRTILAVALVLAGAGEQGEQGRIELEHLDADLREQLPKQDGGNLEALEASAVERVLGEVAGNVSAAARKLGVARSTLYRMMQRYGLARG